MMSPTFALLASVLFGCGDPPTPDVHVDALVEPPAEVDTHQDICDEGNDGKNLFAEPFWAEEMCATISVPEDDYFIEARQVSLDFTDYCVEYQLLNESGELAKYCNGLQLHVDAGETAIVGMRIVSFDQKDQIDDAFPLGTDVNVHATMTLYATNSWNGEQLDFPVNYDIIMTDFDRCDGGQVVTCQQ